MSKLITLFIGCVLTLSLGTSLEAKKMNALVRSVKGYAEFARPNTEAFRPLQPGTRIPPGSTIKTSDATEVILRVVPGAALRIAENTVLVLDDMVYEEEQNKVKKRQANVRLSEGTVSALLKSKEGKVTDFRIQTPQGSAAARGTFYGVSVEDGQTYVSVKEGKVGLKLNEAEEAEE